MANYDEEVRYALFFLREDEKGEKIFAVMHPADSDLPIRERIQSLSQGVQEFTVSIHPKVNVMRSTKTGEVVAYLFIEGINGSQVDYFFDSHKEAGTVIAIVFDVDYILPSTACDLDFFDKLWRSHISKHKHRTSLR